MNPSEALAPNPIPKTLSDSDGVSMGLEGKPTLSVSPERLRSMVDRLSKAMTWADRGDTAKAWGAVGRVENELRSLLDG